MEQIKPTELRIGNYFQVNWSKPERQKLRSKTYPGIAAAMAAQWSAPVYEQQLKLAI